MPGKTFTFGKNWKEFINTYLNDARIEEAKDSLIYFCGGNNLIRGRRFLDIGCGSGLFSLAAFRLGASEVMSFDVDTDSVDCCRELKKKESSPESWTVVRGSVIDPKFLSEIGTYAFVYAWGVLHHTGAMWDAVRQACGRVAEGGYLFLALYNKADIVGFMPDGRFGTSSFWTAIKHCYVSLPGPLRFIFEAVCAALLFIVYLLSFRNPLAVVRGHKNNRGMAWMTDLRDWLGGYPYEYAAADEVFRFVAAQGFILENLKTNNGLRNNEFLFKKRKLAP